MIFSESNSSGARSMPASYMAIIFDFQEGSYGQCAAVNITDESNEVAHRILTAKHSRVQRAMGLANKLLLISQYNPESDDGWTRMDELVPGKGKLKAVKDERKVVSQHLRNISEDFDDVLEFRNISRTFEVRPSRPFGVAFTARSKKVIGQYGQI